MLFFASDFHLGLRTPRPARLRENLAVQWLRSIYPQCEQLFLLGDTFDFWYEYRHVIPKGHTRFLATLCEFADSGKKVHIFVGNHDVWLHSYLEQEVGATIYRQPTRFSLNGHTIYMAHGDGLGPGGYGYKLLKACFHNRALQALFYLVHPDLAMALGLSWSYRGRHAKQYSLPFRQEREPIVAYTQHLLRQQPAQLYLYGHMHIPILYQLNGTTPPAYLAILGDWITHDTYAQLDGDTFSLWQYRANQPPRLLQQCTLAQ